MNSLRSSGLVLLCANSKTDLMVDAQADPGLRWIHTSFCLFCHDLLDLCKA